MASVMIKNATKGQGKAMTALYEENKDRLYTVARALLQNEELAANAVTKAFREIWNDLKNSRIATTEQFADFALMAVEAQCRKLILQKNPKALRAPHSKSFQLPANLLVKDTQNDELSYLLANLPMLQRYIFVLRQACTVDTLAVLLNLEPALVQTAIATEEENFQKLQALSAKGYQSTYAQLQEMVTQSAALPEKADTACREHIQALASAAESTLKKQKRTQIIVIAVIAVCVVLITVIGILATGGNNETSNGAYTTTTSTNTGANTATDEIPKNSAPALDKSLTYYADIDIANYGKITVKLDQSVAPATCANFVNLAQSGFYNGLTFHRIMEGFMMQGGCPDGTGGGSAKENVVGEFLANGYENPLSHTRGAISMARADPYNSGSSQFFIVHKDSTFLDGNYACFGYVTEGIEVVDAVCEASEPIDGNGTIPASAQPIINSITIRTETPTE